MNNSRKTVTQALTRASESYWLKKGFSCFTELGLTKWGKLRADVLALRLDGHIVQMEVKSSVADYKTDQKWEQYLPFSNKMYFVMLPEVWQKLRDKMHQDGVFKLGIGLMVLDPKTGYLRVVKAAKTRKMCGKNKKALVIRMAWRNGISKRNSRRTRQFVSESEVNDATAV